VPSILHDASALTTHIRACLRVRIVQRQLAGGVACAHINCCLVVVPDAVIALSILLSHLKIAHSTIAKVQIQRPSILAKLNLSRRPLAAVAT